MNSPLQGAGLTVTLPGAFTASIMNVDWSGMGVEDIDTSDVSTVWRTFDPSVLKNPGELKLHIHFDPDQSPPMGTKGNIQVTYPVPAGKTTGAKWACNGYHKGLENTAPYDNKMTADLTLKFSGTPTFTPSS